MSSSLLSAAGVIVAAGLACAAILMPRGNRRSLVILGALAAIPVLILGDQWDSDRIVALRDSPLQMAAGGLVAVLVVAGAAALFHRRPILMPLAIAAALPFRVPLQAGDEQANLLVPLYLMIAAAAVYVAIRDRSRPSAPAPDRAAPASAVAPPAPGPAAPERGWLSYLIVAVVALYALQSLYSEDLSGALREVCFFLVPFSILFVLLRECEWSPRLLVYLLLVFTVEAAIFTLFGVWEYVTRTVIWNPAVMQANDFHTYFRVNSLFWDPNMFGRFLALVAVALAAVIMWAREMRVVLVCWALIVLVWIGIFITFSLSSFVALLVGLAVLAALRWSVRWTAIAAAACVALALVFAAIEGGFFETDWGLSNRTSGRSDLVIGGIELFGKRPLTGYGSAAFSESYLDEIANGQARVTESHTEPVTVAAEQGLPGLIVYIGLIVVALGTVSSGLRARLPELRGAAAITPETLARAAVLAVFVALMVHTLSYAGFLEDPVTWLLFALIASLGAAGKRRAGSETPG